MEKPALLSNGGKSKTNERGGCGFLRAQEIEAWLEDRLSLKRRVAFQEHQAGCKGCTLLAVDLCVLRSVAAGGLLVTELREFESTKEIVKARLRQALVDEGTED